MVNDLRELLRDNVTSPPHDDLDLGAVVAGGRRRVRRRRFAIVGTTLATAVLVGAASVTLRSAEPPDFAASGVPRPDAPTLRLSDAESAKEGTDYRVLASYTNENLNSDNGQYFDGVTDDGLILFRDGPRMGQPHPRFALMDPATGEKDWLPDLDVGQVDTWPLELGEDRLVLLGTRGDRAKVDVVVHVYDREFGRWTTTAWPDLPTVDNPFAARLGPDGRLYVPVPATQGRPPEGGWPTGPHGEADDADAEGDTYRLWSASLGDATDVRDEGLLVGSLAFTDDSMVWTDSTNGDAGRVHVRNLESGEDRSFDPHSGERCNLLSFGATDDRIVMSEYCGTYDDGVRDDRVQVLDTDGNQVVTLQGSGIEGALASDAGDGLVTVTSYESGGNGTYVYDLGSGRFLQISDDVSSWVTSGPTQEGQFLWNTPENWGRGMTQHLGEIVG
jgi:hypothetical protein